MSRSTFHISAPKKLFAEHDLADVDSGEPALDNWLRRRARGERRVIFTQDSGFLRLHAAGHPHYGIVYASQGKSIGETIHGLMLLHQVLDADEMEGHVEFL